MLPAARPSYVLIVDDEPSYRELLCELVEVLDVAAVAAPSGQAARTYLRDHPPPAVILLDLGMPGLTGHDVRAAILADPALAPIPVIVCTGREQDRDHPALRGVAAYEVKPVAPDRLLGLVSRYAAPGEPA